MKVLEPSTYHSQLKKHGQELNIPVLVAGEVVWGGCVVVPGKGVEVGGTVEPTVRKWCRGCVS